MNSIEVTQTSHDPENVRPVDWQTREQEFNVFCVPELIQIPYFETTHRISIEVQKSFSAALRQSLTFE